MRITDQKGVSSLSGARGARPASGTGARFTLEQGAASPKAEALAPTVMLGSLEALIALQSGESGRERRRRSVRRGQGMLDLLDELKLALLSGHLPADMQRRLAGLLNESLPSGDLQLDSILEGIELRAAVELAKLRTAEARSRGEE